MTTTNRPHNLTRAESQWSISYTQSDVDTIREQIEQNESAKRRRLLLAAVVLLLALGGTIALLVTNYGLYASSESDKKRLTQENAALKSRADQTQQQLDAKTAQETKQAQARSDSQTKLDKILPSVLRGDAGSGEIAEFARMVYNLPGGKLELSGKPPDKLFRNWRSTSGSSTDTFALVGGFVDGKWVVYSNLVAKKQSSD